MVVPLSMRKDIKNRIHQGHLERCRSRAKQVVFGQECQLKLRTRSQGALLVKNTVVINQRKRWCLILYPIRHGQKLPQIYLNSRSPPVFSLYITSQTLLKLVNSHSVKLRVKMSSSTQNPLLHDTGFLRL